jgi:hypothetical protein
MSLKMTGSSKSGHGVNNRLQRKVEYIFVGMADGIMSNLSRREGVITKFKNLGIIDFLGIFWTTTLPLIWAQR